MRSEHVVLLLGVWLCLSGIADATGDVSATHGHGKAVQVSQHGLAMQMRDDHKMPSVTGKDEDEDADNKDNDYDNSNEIAGTEKGEHTAKEDDVDDDNKDDGTYKIAVGIIVPLAAFIALGLWKFNFCRRRRETSIPTAVPVIVSTVEPKSLEMHGTISRTPRLELSHRSDALDKIAYDY